MLRILLFLILVVTTVACSPIFERSEEDPLLAEVYGKQLYASDLAGMIPKGTTFEDSIRRVEAYVERWAREELILQRAEKNIPQNWNVDELVENYRASLIRHHYEEALIAEGLTTAISDEELKEFYEKNKAQYDLEQTIFTCYFIKLASDIERPKEFRDWWDACVVDSSACNELRTFCEEFAEIQVLEDTTWFTLDEFAFLLPENILTEENIRSKREFTQRDEAFDYFFKSFEIVNKKGIAPLSYIEEQAKKFILKQRKEELLEKTKTEMYEDELERGNVQILMGRE